MVFDRGYDDIKLIRYVVNCGDDIIVRLKENRTYKFYTNELRTLDKE